MATDLLSGEKKKNCVACFAKDLTIVKTFKMQKLSLNNKQETLKNTTGCFSCLKPGHRSNHSKQSISSTFSSKRHNMMMCLCLEDQRKNPAMEKVTEEEQVLSLSTQLTLQTI